LYFFLFHLTAMSHGLLHVSMTMYGRHVGRHTLTHFKAGSGTGKLCCPPPSCVMLLTHQGQEPCKIPAVHGHEADRWLLLYLFLARGNH